MGLSQSDVRQVAAFVRKIAKAPNPEAIVSETFQLLKGLAKIDRVRIVYSPVPGRWTEWISSSAALEVRTLEEWPEPENKSATAFFDTDSEHSGFVSTTVANEKARLALDVVAPEVWSALLLRAAVDRVQNAVASEGELARANLRARDEERRRIARELHDDLGQSLASLKLGLKWAQDRVRNQEVSAVIDELEKAREEMGVMMDKIRDLSHTLYPRILDTLGLVAAVKELVYQASRFSPLLIQYETEGTPRPLGRETEIALYRCCQEGISNAIRHSAGSKILVRISFARKEIRVTVEDNGKGFDPRALYDSNPRMMSSGFWTIRQRMADIGAAFRVSTAEAQGTVVEMIVPYPAREAYGKGKNKSTHRR